MKKYAGHAEYHGGMGPFTLSDEEIEWLAQEIADDWLPRLGRRTARKLLFRAWYKLRDPRSVLTPAQMAEIEESGRRAAKEMKELERRARPHVEAASAVRRKTGSDSRQRVEVEAARLRKANPRLTRDKAAELICKRVNLSFHRTVKLLSQLKLFGPSAK